MNHYQIIRKNLQNRLPDGLTLISSSKPVVRNHDVHYDFRQNSDFLYLTGIEHPGYHVLLDPKNQNSHLFIPDEDIKFQIWEGKQLTRAEAKKEFGFQHVHTHSEFENIFQKLKKKYKTVHCLKENKDLLPSKQIKTESQELRKALNTLRSQKTKGEIALMKIANEISSEAHEEAMSLTEPGLKENEVQAAFLAYCQIEGARLQAYGPIFAAGSNAAILHYRDNNQLIKKNDLLLIDAGCEWKGYASDITRTFPANGKFSKKQAQIYDIVLDAQKECIKKAHVGNNMGDLHKLSEEIMTQGLIDLKIFKSKNVQDILESGAMKIFFPHGLGHMLGLDVHDVGGKKKKNSKLRNWIDFAPGHVVTIEPGLYFIDAHFRNPKTRKEFAKIIDWKKAESYKAVGGIRIEDNIHILKKGNENLTFAAKERKDIEDIMSA